MPTPWSLERRAAVKRKIDKEADRAAARLNADGAVLIVFFPDGDHLHMLDGGKSPVPLKELYQRILSAMEMLEQSGGEDISIS